MKPLNPSDAAYFVGLFDGEGCFITHYRKRGKMHDYALLLRIVLRDDDEEVLTSLKEQLGGRICYTRHKPPTNRSVSWWIQNIKELAENIVPVFDAYPLRSKKRFEYSIWRELVVERYKSKKKLAPDFETRFLEAIRKIREIRRYKRVQEFST
jgi:hypothetical protein